MNFTKDELGMVYQISETTGHDRMDLVRFQDDTRHMILFDVLSNASPVGDMGERVRLFLNNDGYRCALASEAQNEIKILAHANVYKGRLTYDCKHKGTGPER